MARSLMQLAQEGKTRRFWIKDGLLITRGNCLYVSKVGDLRKEILRECHAAGHPRRTLALIARGDYWPKMEEEVSGYVRTCRLCQQDKVEQAKPAGWSPCLYQRDRACWLSGVGVQERLTSFDT